MEPWNSYEQRKQFERMVKDTHVKQMWPLSPFVESTPPTFKFDYELAYTILAMLVIAELNFEDYVWVNKGGLSDVFEVTKKNVNEHMAWLCVVGLIRREIVIP